MALNNEAPMSAGEAAVLATANLTNANAALQHQLAVAQGLRNRETNTEWLHKRTVATCAEIAQLTADAEARVKAIEEEMGTAYFEC